ncbi:MAG: hypothetical protein IAE91_01925 [Ignavibacteriaceae bacterium]|nr:hypothetical protein [Ignavibacteriaceae bacterium]
MKLLPLLLIVITFEIYGQIRFSSISAGVGAGYIKGNTPSEFAYLAGANFDFHLWFSSKFSFRAGVIYGRDFSILVPEDRYGRNYPYLQGASLSIVATQYVSDDIFFEGTGGFLMLNDRSFSDIDEWAPGSAISVTVNKNFYNRLISKEGISVSASFESGFTFFKTLPQYYGVLVKLRYNF